MSQKYVVIASDGSNSFYDSDANSIIPTSAIKISDADYATFFSVQGAYIFSSDGVLTSKVKAYVIRNGTYLYDYEQSGDIIVTERPTASNSYTSYTWDYINGWTIDKKTSLDNLNSLYSNEKSELHKSHSSILLNSSLTDAQVSVAESILKTQYKALQNELLTKQGAL